MSDCEDCGGGLLGGPHEPWCMNDYTPPRVQHRPKPTPGARCYSCRQRIQDCQCPDGPDPD